MWHAKHVCFDISADHLILNIKYPAHFQHILLLLLLLLLLVIYLYIYFEYTILVSAACRVAFLRVVRCEKTNFEKFRKILFSILLIFVAR